MQLMRKDYITILLFWITYVMLIWGLMHLKQCRQQGQLSLSSVESGSQIYVRGDTLDYVSYEDHAIITNKDSIFRYDFKFGKTIDTTSILNGPINNFRTLSAPCVKCGPFAVITVQPNGGTPSYDYLWNTNTVNPSITVFADDFFTVTVTDANGCSTTDFIDVNIVDMNVTISENNCQLTATATGGDPSYSYNWNTTEITQTITANQDITYTVTVTDNNGCSFVQSISVTGCECNCEIVPQAPITVCQGVFSTITASVTGCTGTVSYCWIPINGVCAGNMTPDQSFTCSCGSFPYPCTSQLELLVTDANGCTDLHAFQYVCDQCATCNLTADIIGDNNICPNEVNVLTATGSTNGTTSYNWAATNGGNISGGTTGSQINATTDGTYCVTITETQQGLTCTDTDCFAIAVDNNCTDCTCTPIVSYDAANCEIDYTTSGAGCDNYTYQFQYSQTGSGWSTLATGTAPVTSSYTTPIEGFYRLVINGGNGCSGSVSNTVELGYECEFEIDINSALSGWDFVSINGFSGATCGANNSQIWGAITNGFTPSCGGPPVDCSERVIIINNSNCNANQILNSCSISTFIQLSEYISEVNSCTDAFCGNSDFSISESGLVFSIIGSQGCLDKAAIRLARRNIDSNCNTISTGNINVEADCCDCTLTEI